MLADSNINYHNPALVTERRTKHSEPRGRETLTTICVYAISGS
jgi:hypothetical protein